MSHKIRFALVSFLIFFCSDNVAQQRTIIELQSSRLCPYSCKGYQGDGFVVELIRSTSSELNMHFNYLEIPSARLGSSASKKNNIVLRYSDNKNTPDTGFFLLNEPVISSRMCFFTTRETSWWYSGVGSLLNIRLGVLHGHSYKNKALLKYINDSVDGSRNVIILKNQNAMLSIFKMLIYGRIDAVLLDNNIARYLIGKIDLNYSLKIAGCLEERVYYYIFLSNKKYKTEIERILNRYKHDGYIRYLKERYGIKY